MKKEDALNFHHTKFTKPAIVLFGPSFVLDGEVYM
jgi:hypothetical protein